VLLTQANRDPAARGFTLLEVVFALSIIAIGLIASAPMFVLASGQNAGGGDMGQVGSMAVERMEQLRGTNFFSLVNGGSLDVNVADFSDTSNPAFDVRWMVADSPGPTAGMKILAVRAVAKRRAMGRPKEVTLIGLRGE